MMSVAGLPTSTSRRSLAIDMVGRTSGSAAWSTGSLLTTTSWVAVKGSIPLVGACAAVEEAGVGAAADQAQEHHQAHQDLVMARDLDGPPQVQCLLGHLVSARISGACSCTAWSCTVRTDL